MAQHFDLCLAWNWVHDGAFVRILDETCRSRGVSLLQITPDVLPQMIERLGGGDLTFAVLLDRVSEEDPRFVAIAEWARGHEAESVNPYDRARRTWDKVALHRAIFADINTPYTIILPSHRAVPALPPVDLAPVGGRGFTIKPATGGGGAGVVLSADTFEQILEARKQFPDDEYLLQTRVVPAPLGGQAAWFRVIYSSGEVFPCWWATDTHRYRPLTAAEESHFKLAQLGVLAHDVARHCGLQLFSTEIARAVDGGFLVVDCVNDPIDLRLQSQIPEGVPDQIVQFIAENLASWALAARSRVAVR